MISDQNRRRLASGVAHRARIATELVPGLDVGIWLPSTRTLGEWLGLCQQQALRHLRKVLTASGIEVRRKGVCGRLCVTKMPQRETLP